MCLARLGEMDQSDTKQGRRSSLVWLGTATYCHGMVNLPLLLYSLLVYMQKTGSHADEKEQLYFSTTEGHVDCPAVGKLNF